MRTLKLALVAAAASLCFAGAAAAEDDSGPSFSFNLGASSDYLFRGFSQTDKDPQVYGGVDATVGIGYAGIWVSNVDFLDSTDAEFDIYAGVTPTIGAVSLDLGVIYYGYIDKGASNYDYWEFKATASVPAGPATLGVAAYYSPNFFGAVDDALYYEANASVDIPDSKFSISGAIGRQQLDGPGDYTTWNVGVGFALNDHVSFDVRYWDTNVSKAADPSGYGDARVVGGIKLAW
ncbi:TorF family putative porin [Phenylobacterium sp.]|uniref:TorF family putative porin n=1 Tax=Phenylobacterium sp. TaxID=1871053 RepID=UPI0025E2AAB6|nr:TorF family putative porin [Phenylobacterium sp.]MBX3483153.1 TorF family putative porin [Phenylobacterium sp.]MCW5759558.1 TorF family putative porin [Phenylobacterium sp.]